MEPLGILAGLALGLVTGILGATLRITKGKTPEGRVSALEAEMRALRAEVDDTLEKTSRLHDRIRKRTLFKPSEEEDAQRALPLDRKADLRKRARERGIFRATTYPVR